MVSIRLEDPTGASLPDARPEPVETGAYYLVAEAVTNVAQYTNATPWP